jgi:hypothetical protein
MYRNEAIPKRMRTAAVMLVFLLLASIQLMGNYSLFSTAVQGAVPTDIQLSSQQFIDHKSIFNLDQSDNQLFVALVLAFTLLLFLYFIVKRLNYKQEPFRYFSQFLPYRT